MGRQFLAGRRHGVPQLVADLGVVDDQIHRRLHHCAPTAARLLVQGGLRQISAVLLVGGGQQVWAWPEDPTSVAAK